MDLFNRPMTGNARTCLLNALLGNPNTEVMHTESLGKRVFAFVTVHFPFTCQKQTPGAPDTVKVLFTKYQAVPPRGTTWENVGRPTGDVT